MRGLAPEQLHFDGSNPHGGVPVDAVPSAALSSPLLTQHQAAEYLNTTGPTLQRWRSMGYGPAFLKVGRRVAYSKPDLYTWLLGQRHTSTRAPTVDPRSEVHRVVPDHRELPYPRARSPKNARAAAAKAAGRTVTKRRR